MIKLINRLSAALTVSLVVGCASSQSIPLTINTDPLGAYVLLQVQQQKSEVEADWIFLGNTPVDITRDLILGDTEQVKIRVVKEGYFDQTRQWQTKQLKKEVKQQQRLFWNPRLVPGRK